MTRSQREIARYALGLTNGRLTSYRNWFVCGPGHANYKAWRDLEREGLAIRHDGGTLQLGGNDLFRLTHDGAYAALGLGETLDPEDFPCLTPGTVA